MSDLKCSHTVLRADESFRTREWISHETRESSISSNDCARYGQKPTTQSLGYLVGPKQELIMRLSTIYSSFDWSQ